MYFGDEGPGRLQQLIDELVSNAIDQFLRGHCSRVDVQCHEDGLIDVADDGPGLPFDVAGSVDGVSLAENYLLDPHFTATADGGVPHVHVHGSRGCGIALVNAACETLVCRSWRNGACWEQSFFRSQPLAPPRVIAHGPGRGTQFRLKADLSILGTSSVDSALLRATLWRAAHLFAGLVVGCGRETFVAPGGLRDLLSVMHEPTEDEKYVWGSRPLFRWQGRCGDYAIDAAAGGFVRARGRRCRWHSWVNGCATPRHGSHVDGFAHALKTCDWKPAIAMLHVVAHDARYAGPTRDRLALVEASEAIRAALEAPLQRYCAEHRVDRCVV